MRAWGLVAAILGSSIAGCAPEPPAVPEDCRVTELTDVVRSAPPDRADVLVVVDTHASDDGERSATAVRLAESIRVIVSGDTDHDGLLDFDPIDDLWITLVPAMPGCGSAQRFEWRATAEAPGDPDALAGAVGDAITALPACDRSAPIETAALALEGARRAYATLMIVAVTDEDEPGAPDRVPALVIAASEPLAPAAITVLAGIDPAHDPWPRSWAEWRADEGCHAAPIDAAGAPGIVDAAGALWSAGLYATLGSICTASWVSALEPLVPRSADPIPCFCLPRASYPPGACTVIEQLDPAGYHHRCAELPGRDPTPLGELDGAERCLVLASDGTSPGWIASGTPLTWTCESICGAVPAIAWIGGDPEPGSRIELRCTEVSGTCGPPGPRGSSDVGNGRVS